MKSIQTKRQYFSLWLIKKADRLRHGLTFGILATVLSVVPLWAASAKTLYIPLGVANQIVEIDTDSFTVRTVADQLDNPHGLAISPDGRFLYAGSMLEKTAAAEQPKSSPEGVSEEEHTGHHTPAASGAPDAPKTFSFITRVNAKTGKIERRIDVKKFTHHLAVSPDGSTVIGVQSGASRIVVIDAETDKVLRYVQVGIAPNYALVTRNSDRVFVSTAGSNSLVVLDMKTWETIASIPVGKAPEHMTFSTDEKFLYAVNVGSGELSIVDTISMKEIKRVPTGESPHGVAFNESSQSVIVSNKGADSISIFDPKGNLQQEIPLAPKPYHVANGYDDAQIWISSRKEGKIWVLSTKDFSIKKTLSLPGIGHQMVKAL